MTALSTVRECRRKEKLMGCAFEFVTTGDDDVAVNYFMEAAIAEVKRIEALLTEFSPSSQTSQLNQAAGTHSVKVDAEVYAIIKRCKELSRLTQGAFDITAGVLKKLYNFKGAAFEMPSQVRIKEALSGIGSDKIILEEDGRIKLSKKGMHIGFGAIGKGYAADKVKTLLQQEGMKSGVINASGDLTAWGTRTDGSPWKVGIADPDEPSRILMWIPVNNASVATSGDYEQRFEIDGIRYSHNLDPRSGKPVTGIKSVTIVSPSAELSDALATAVTIMGADAGLHFINQLPGIHGLIITAENKIISSKHLNVNLNA